MAGWNKGRVAFILMVLMAVVLGCAKQEQPSAGSGRAGAQGSAPGAAETKRVIKHEMGETTITGTPKKIVTLYQGANDVAVALGIKPVGIVESWMEQPVYHYLRPTLEGIPVLGAEHQPNLEELYKLQPDVIFATKIRHEKIYDQLSQIAPTVMIGEVYDWKATVRLMGEVLGQQDKTNQMMLDWDKRVADFKKKMGSRLPMEATITNFRPDHARIFYMGYAGGILKELGFTRPKGHDQNIWGVMLTTKESIKDMDADLIFNFNSGTAADQQGGERLYKDWTEHPLWKNLRAVKNNQVVQVNEVDWNFAGGYISANRMLDALYAFFKLEK